VHGTGNPRLLTIVLWKSVDGGFCTCPTYSRYSEGEKEKSAIENLIFHNRSVSTRAEPIRFPQPLAYPLFVFSQFVPALTDVIWGKAI
jgi:hypothetical protein